MYFEVLTLRNNIIFLFREKFPSFPLLNDTGCEIYDKITYSTTAVCEAYLMHASDLLKCEIDLKFYIFKLSL